MKRYSCRRWSNGHEFLLCQGQRVKKGVHQGLAKAPAALTGSLLVVYGDPYQTRHKPATRDVVYWRRSADALSLADGCADLALMSMVYHYLSDPSAVGHQCHRVLRIGGYPSIRSSTRASDFPHRHFFPALGTLIASHLSSRRDVQSIFAAGGFDIILHQIGTPVSAPDWPRFMQKSALRADSFLARLSDADFQQGKAALYNHGEAISRSDLVTEQVD